MDKELFDVTTLLFPFLESYHFLPMMMRMSHDFDLTPIPKTTRNLIHYPSPKELHKKHSNVCIGNAKLCSLESGAIFMLVFMAIFMVGLR